MADFISSWEYVCVVWIYTCHIYVISHTELRLPGLCYLLSYLVGPEAALFEKLIIPTKCMNYILNDH